MVFKNVNNSKGTRYIMGGILFGINGNIKSNSLLSVTGIIVVLFLIIGIIKRRRLLLFMKTDTSNKHFSNVFC